VHGIFAACSVDFFFASDEMLGLPIEMYFFSPNYATKKYPELMSGLKSAANNMAKKLSELKESMTASQTPIKGGPG